MKSWHQNDVDIEEVEVCIMFHQILKTTKGKWAVALVVIAVLGTIGSISNGTAEALPGSLILLAVAAVLVMSAIKAIKNPPPAPTLEDQGIRISQEDLDAFNTYGKLPQISNSPVMLVEGEQAVYACRAERVETKNRRIGTTGGGVGGSIRVTKGVSIRTGGTGSKSVYGDVEMVHGGEFVVTTDRIVFVANNRAYAEKLADISAVSVDSGCLTIMAGNSNYAMRMPCPEYPCEIIKHCINAL